QAAAAIRPAPAADSYLVQPGDSLAVIARRTGVSQRDLLAFNNLTDANLVRSGSRLRLVPAQASSDAASPPTATVASASPPAVAAARPAAVAPDLPALETPAQARQPTGDAGGISASLADPSNYLVAANDKVEVQAA